MARPQLSWIISGLAAAVLTSFAPAARADYFFSPTFSYEEEKEEDSSSTSKVTETNIDVRLGYAMSGGFYFGGLYNTENVDRGSGITERGTSLGASVGYVTPNFNLIGTYHLKAERTDNPSTTKYTEGTGPQIDLGYAFDVGSGFALGPQFTWRSIEYAKRQIGGGAITNTKLKVTEIRPMVALVFRF